MTTSSASIASWQPMALCRHYFSTHFEGQVVEVKVPGSGTAELTVSWAMGVLVDGGWEALGAWPGTAFGQGFWQGVWEDFDERGVDKLSLVHTADLDAKSLCPTAKVLPPFRRILGPGFVPAASSVGVLRGDARCVVREASGVRAARIALERLLANSEAGRVAVLSPDWPEVLEQFRAFYALRPHLRAVVRAGDEYLEQLGIGLRRAVSRHGSFADSAAAVSFVAQTISRDELRLKFSMRPKAARPILRLVGSDAAGLASLGH